MNTETFLGNANTSHRIRALLAARGLPAEVLAPLLEVTTATIYNRMRDCAWSVADINKIAEHYGVNPKDLV